MSITKWALLPFCTKGKKTMKNNFKKLSCFLLAALLSVGMLASCTQTPTEEVDAPIDSEVVEPEKEEVKKPVETFVSVYLDNQNGLNENDGKAQDEPVKTFAEAFKKLNISPETTKTLVLKGASKIEESGEFPANGRMIKITSDGVEGTYLSMGNNGLTLSGDIALENIELKIVANNKFINTFGHKLVIGENITKSVAEGKKDALNVHAGTYNTDGKRENVSVASPVNAFYLGAYYNDDTHTTEGADIFVNENGKIDDLIFGSDGWTDTQMGVVYTDTVNITLNGGEIGKVALMEGKRAAGFECALQFIVNNGSTLPEIPEEISPIYGLYIIECENAEGCAIEAGKTAGVYNVLGGKTAVATDENGKKYISANGILSLPEGRFDVSFTDEVVYTNDGENIEIMAKSELDLSTVRHNELEGKLFVGWKYANGKDIKKQSFKKGDKLRAQYVDFDASSDFKAVDAMLDTENGNAIKFIVEKSGAIENLDVVTDGILVIPTSALGTRELKKGVTYNGVTATVVTDTENLGTKDGVTSFAASIDGITEEGYRDSYTAKGFVVYKDIYGNERTLYTEAITADFYKLIQLELAKDNISEEKREEYKKIEESVKQGIREKYDSENKIDVVGTSADKKSWIYKLEETGIMVREVDIDTGFDGDPVEIVQLTDLHFNYCNERDFEEQNPSIMATLKGRKWLANAASVPNAVRCLDYASFADQIVVTGDALDYMSWGCIELMKKHVFDAHPTVMATLGNHEATRRCQDEPKTPDPTTLESRMEILQENWIHDIYYYSKVLEDRVMLIQMDDGAGGVFWDSQVEPFKKDLELAREKGYTVLMFFHIPLCTNNPAEQDLYPIRRNDTNNYNFMINGVGKEGAEGATKEVYDLITNNADVIKGIFTGHFHSDYYTEIIAKNADGTDAVIPQYILTGTPYDKGHALRITVR